MNSDPDKTDPGQTPAAVEGAPVVQRLERWASSWFRGVAYCPLCESDEDITVTARRLIEAAIIEIWKCLCCGGKWRVELREHALLVEDGVRLTYEPHEWIERDDSSPDGIRVSLPPIDSSGT